MSSRAIIDELHRTGPLVQAITNYVAMDISANALLATGASPAMIHAEEEAAEFAGLASAVLINIGTLSPAWVRGMEAAASAARAKGTPVVLDPVGAGATAYRREVSRRLLSHAAVVRGNASEVRALVEEGAAGRGVDATDSTESLTATAEALAQSHGIVVAMTGTVDVVTDGERRVQIRGGHAYLTQVTAAGCALSAVVAAACAVGPKLEATVAALALYKDAAERAAQRSRGPGSFRVALIDALADTPADVDERVQWL